MRIDRRDLNYRATLEPRLKAQARKHFFEKRYREVVLLESQIQFPSFSQIQSDSSSPLLE